MSRRGRGIAARAAVFVLGAVLGGVAAVPGLAQVGAAVTRSVPAGSVVTTPAPAAPLTTTPAPADDRAPRSWPSGSDSPQSLAPRFEAAVDRRNLPGDDAKADYAARLAAALSQAGVVIDRPQIVLMVDRHRLVQTGMLWWIAPDGATGLVGAFPVSTGRPSGFDHYETPLGVFAHALANPDFRAEGTKNELGIRGYGVRGMRVYDFGWVRARRGWAPGEQDIRLQVHATDPDRLEQRLGQQASKGCIRIPATANRFIDRYGLLDADYDAELDAGRHPWVLNTDRVRTPWSGRWLVIVDSGATTRPEWSPAPRAGDAPEAVLARQDC